MWEKKKRKTKGRDIAEARFLTVNNNMQEQSTRLTRADRRNGNVIYAAVPRGDRWKIFSARARHL